MKPPPSSRLPKDDRAQRRIGWGRRTLAELRASGREQRARELKASLPGLVISIAIHVVLLLLGSLFYVRLTQDPPRAIELDWARAIVDPADAVDAVIPVEIPSTAPRAARVADGGEVNGRPSEAAARASSTPVAPVAVSSALDLRKHRARRRALLGSEETGREEDAIALALQWLAGQQSAAGHWSLQGPYDDGGSVETLTGATSLALLCFLGDAQTHRAGTHRETMQRGIEWLVSMQRPDGDLFDIPEQGQEAHFYAHAQGTIVLCEAIALTGDDALRPAAERAVQFLIDAQNPVLGGWKYRPLTETGVGDLSVTGWVLMALHSARMARIEVPSESFLLASRFLDSVQERPGDAARYKYRPDFAAEESQQWSMTAEGLLCRQWLGWPPDQPALVRGAQFLTSARCEPSWGANRRNVYAWYYTAQTLHNLGGKPWERWYHEMASLLIGQQQRTGKAKGSWHPFRPPGAIQERSRDGGRLYVTALCVLILETPFRHAPLYVHPPLEPAADGPRP